LAQWNKVPSQRKKQFILQPPCQRTALQPINNKFALLADTLDDDELPTDADAIACTVPPTNNTFALLADTLDDDALPTNAIACTVHELPTIYIACPVLDHETGQTLEHGQLQGHPKYKAIWDQSYADEIFCLCQGGGKHPTKPNQQ
jgi:hypothetical protein